MTRIILVCLTIIMLALPSTAQAARPAVKHSRAERVWEPVVIYAEPSVDMVEVWNGGRWNGWRGRW